MFFKRVEIVGFKSFATRTNFELIPGTTVIVGPNGCGKSNILDAVKWVLGEQAASQMRGKRMNDVIFSGSASFKPLGMAQVTLTIDNSRGILPMDFGEIQVTRRLFRSGESEYLINKVPCRLRDVQDLFLGTGIGKSAYSVIEQGRIDQIINAKPIDRRGLVEEAAGISKYRLRKMETLRKLERSDQDLARLGDTIIEIERQVSSLKRQAAKAERYRQYSDQLSQSERQWLALQAADFRSRLKALNEELTARRDRLTELRTRLTARSAVEEEARQQKDELFERLIDEKQAHSELKSNLSGCDQQLTRLNDQIARHARRAEEIQTEFKELETHAAEIDLRIQEAAERYQSAEKERAAEQTRFKELDRRYDEVKRSVSENAESIDQHATEVNQIRETFFRADNELSTSRATIERQSQLHEEAQGHARELEERRESLATRHRELLDAAAILEKKVERIESELEAGRNLQAERRGRIEQWTKELEEIRRKLHASLSRLETLRELRANYEGYQRGVREVMLAAEREELKGVLGVVANMIRTQRDHELVIEAALNTHLQDVVTERTEDARAAIEHLAGQGLGRATFLPLDRLRATDLSESARAALEREGVVGLASDLVECDAKIESVVRHLLGATIVVRDLQLAQELAADGIEARFVSLDGQLIDSSGAMTGGRIQAGALLTREREIHDLEEAVEQLGEQQTSTSAQLEQVNRETAAEHERLEGLKSNLDDRRHELTSMRKDFETAERALNETQEQLDGRRRQLEAIDREIVSCCEQVEQMTSENDRRRDELAARENQLAELRGTVRDQNEHVIELSTTLAEARAQVERARIQMVDAQQRREEYQESLGRIGRQREAKLKEIESIEHEDTQLTDQISRVQAEMEEIEGQREQMAHRIAEDEDLRVRIELTIDEVGHEVAGLERDEKEALNRVHEQDVNLTELKTSHDHLEQQCQERFEIDLDTLSTEVGEVEKDGHALQQEVIELRGQLGRIGPVNLAALDEYNEQHERLVHYREQHQDLDQARKQLRATIDQLDQTTRRLFQETFDAVRVHFIEMFRRLFNGGKADLILEAPEGLDPLLDGGVEILAQPPGKKLQSITLLSGGEKALTAISLLFGLFMHKPAPFCILDEIDAPLDDVNVERFKALLNEFNKEVQFVIITHNKLTMELADALYGVTMEESGVSKLVSVRFDQAEDLVDAV